MKEMACLYCMIENVWKKKQTSLLCWVFSLDKWVQKNPGLYSSLEDVLQIVWEHFRVVLLFQVSSQSYRLLPTACLCVCVLASVRSSFAYYYHMWVVAPVQTFSCDQGDVSSVTPTHSFLSCPFHLPIMFKAQFLEKHNTGI